MTLDEFIAATDPDGEMSVEEREAMGWAWEAAVKACLAACDEYGRRPWCGTVEEPGLRVSQKSGLNRSILDQGWGACGWWSSSRWPRRTAGGGGFGCRRTAPTPTRSSGRR